MSSIENGIDIIGMGPYQYRSLLIAGFFWITASMQLLLFSFVKHEIQCELILSDVQETILTTSTGVGMLIGSTLWGSFPDKKGRSLSLIVSSSITLIFSLFLSHQIVFSIWNGQLISLLHSGIGAFSNRVSSHLAH